jgi:thiol-disulfide isomerase/thioredoxin
MTNASRRLLLFGVALFGVLGFLAVLLSLLAQPPQTIGPSPPPPTPTPRIVAIVNGEPIHINEWEQTVALDRVMNTLVGQVPPSPEETLFQLVNQHLVLREAVSASIPEADRTQIDDWISNFLTGWNLKETDLDQALTRAGLSRAEFLEEIVPRLLRVQQALQELSPNGDSEAYVADLRRQAEVEVLVDLSVPLTTSEVTLPPQTTPQSTPASSPPPTRPAVSLAAGPHLGEMAPNFTLLAIDGTAVSLADLRGRPVLLNFWASWCDPCREQLPMLQTAYQTGKTSLVVLGIDVRESREKVTAAVAEIAYQARGLPTNLFIDRDGLIVTRHIGPLDHATLDGYLTSLISGAPTPSPAP